MGDQREKFTHEVEKKEDRKLRARKKRRESLWFGLGMFGMIGWAVAVPTLIGVALGIYIDSKWPGRISWTIIFLFIGVTLGCLNAWYWVKRERKNIEGDRND